MIMAAACSQEIKMKGFAEPPKVALEKCIEYSFEIDSLPDGQLPNRGYSLASINDTSAVTDDDGVKLFSWKGDYIYHPIRMCHDAYALAAAYQDIGDTVYLERLKRYVHRMMAESDEFDGAAYFPYRFDYHVNQQQEGLLPTPWYSGMAQGEALGVMVRTFLITRDSSYLEYAHQVFKSFLRPRDAGTPWTVFIDSRGCYWIEEYPVWPPSKTLNGFIYALYGVYDYYQLTKNERARDVLNAGFSTVRNYIPFYRRVGKPSFYGLRFGHFAWDYHLRHIKQLRQLEKMTGDPFFGIWADTLEADFNKTPSDLKK